MINFKRGDHLKSRRLGMVYAHHGLYLGDGKVIHYTGLHQGIFDFKGRVEITDLNMFADSKIENIIVVEHKTPKFGIEERISRAMSRLNEEKYNPFTNNCEHFVRECFDGEKSSVQVQRLVGGVVAICAIPILNYIAKKDDFI